MYSRCLPSSATRALATQDNAFVQQHFRDRNGATMKTSRGCADQFRAGRRTIVIAAVVAPFAAVLPAAAAHAAPDAPKVIECLADLRPV
jgi:hypothetical protein